MRHLTNCTRTCTSLLLAEQHILHRKSKLSRGQDILTLGPKLSPAPTIAILQGNSVSPLKLSCHRQTYSSRILHGTRANLKKWKSINNLYQLLYHIIYHILLYYILITILIPAERYFVTSVRVYSHIRSFVRFY